MEKIYGAVRDLTEYALATGLIAEEDVIYTVNSLLGALGIDDYPGDRAEIIGGAAKLDREKIADGTLLEGILAVILEHASGKGMIDGASVVMRDLFDEYRLYKKIQNLQRQKVEGADRVRRARHHHQPLQTREGSQGDRRGQKRRAEQLSQVPAVH